MKKLLTVVLVFSWVLTFAQQYPDIQLNDIITQAEQNAIGVNKLTDLEKENLRVFLIELYQAGYEQGKKEGIEIATEYLKGNQNSLTSDVIESQINGEFEGWEGETIIKLMNGQIWQQTEYYYHYTYSFMPKVFIYKSGSGYKMKVDGVDKAIGVMLIK